MAIEIWLAFVLACTVVVAIPGPTVLMAVSYAIGKGSKTGWATVPGIVLGDFTAMTVSLAGAGALLAASASLFTTMKLMGAAYLIWLGIKLWRSEPVSVDAALSRVAHDPKDTKDMRSMFWHSYLVTALNPKGLVFFTAFVPQFVDVSQPLFAQFAILTATFLFAATVNSVLWIMLAGKMRALFANPKTLVRLNRTGAGFLIGAGLLTAATSRA